jgi:H+/Cl- antiporter ClcA
VKRQLKFQFPNKPKTYLVLILASIVSLIVISFFLKISDYAQHLYQILTKNQPILAFIITPIAFVAIVYLTKYRCHFVAGSGIPQLIAATDSRNKSIRNRLLSFRVAIEKIGLIFLGMLGGAPIGIEGPSIHVGGSIFYGFNRFLKLKRKLLIHALIAIGGSAGLIIAFNAPIAGFLFAYEEIGRNLKKQALLLIAILCGFVYLLRILYQGDSPYLLDLSKLSIDFTYLWQLIPLAIMAGVLGGIFAKATLYLIKNLTFKNKTKTLVVVALLGLIVALLNWLSEGETAGSGHHQVSFLLTGQTLGIDFIVMKYTAILSSLASSIPGGLFMPSIAIGASIGSEVTSFYTQISPLVIILMAMVAYLSGVIRAPLTSTFVVLEMSASLNLLIPALMVAFIASFISKLISKPPIYEALAEIFLRSERLNHHQNHHGN